MTVALADNALRTVASLDDITRVRVTSVALFHNCPARWRAAMLGHGTPSSSKAAEIGTAVHSIIEQFLLRRFELHTAEWEQHRMGLEALGVPPRERLALQDYLQQIERRREQLMAVEYEFLLPLLPDLPQIAGHIDVLFAEPDGGICIRDHKTNRQFQNADWWRSQFQPLLYATGVAHLWPERPIRFEIGYVNLNEVVRWEVTPDEVQHYRQYLRQRYREMWEEIRVYKRTGNWPERIHEGCIHCPIKKTCSSLQWAHKDFMQSFNNFAGRSCASDETGLIEKFVWAKSVQSSVDHVVEELKMQLISEIQANGRPLVYGNQAYGLRKARRREVGLSRLWEGLWFATQALPNSQALWGEVVQRLNVLTSVKIGELEQFLKEHPELREAIEPLIETVESESETLHVSGKLPEPKIEALNAGG